MTKTKKTSAQLNREIAAALASKRGAKSCTGCSGKGRASGCRLCGVMSGRRNEIAHLKKPANGPKLQYDDSEIEKMFKKSGSKGTIGDHDKTVTAILGDPMYVRRFRMPKWNIQPTVLTTPDVAIRHWHTLGIPTSKGAHQQRADYFRELRKRFDAEHARLIDEGELTYGKNASLIAGGFREDWPAALKDRIRFVASGSSILANAIHLHDALSKTRSPAFQW